MSATAVATYARARSNGRASAPCLPWGRLLGALADADRQALDAIADARRVAVHEAVFRRDDPADAVLVLLDGQVVVGQAAPRPGAVRAERVVHGPAWLDASAAWCSGRHGADAVAQLPSLIAEIALAPLRDCLGERPALALRFIELLAQEVCRLGMQTHELIHKDAPARLAAWLQRQVDGNAQAVLRLAERKRDIATQLGMTPETLSRLMRSLSEQGLIAVSGYTVRVLDARGLARLAGA